MKKYFIWAKCKSNDGLQMFWKNNEGGYTSDLNEAGIYTQEYVDKKSKKYPCITSENIEGIKENTAVSHAFVLLEDVNLLGRSMKCISAID